MGAAVMSMADPRLELHGPPDPGFFIERFRTKCPHRTQTPDVVICSQRRPPEVWTPFPRTGNSSWAW
eukprot:4284987-Pyramimonas_sp.AAC.1